VHKNCKCNSRLYRELDEHYNLVYRLIIAPFLLDAPPADCTTDPPAVAHATWHCGTSTPNGRYCNATCDEGFAGSPTAPCLKPDQWGNITGSCKATGA